MGKYYSKGIVVQEKGSVRRRNLMLVVHLEKK
jgi:hypothetical protein